MAKTPCTIMDRVDDPYNRAMAIMGRVDDPDNRAIASLVMHGFPYREVVSWAPDHRDAFLIICGQLDGGEWDWDLMQWKSREEV